MNGRVRRWLLGSALAGLLLVGRANAQEPPVAPAPADAPPAAVEAPPVAVVQPAEVKKKEEEKPKEEEPAESPDHTLHRAGNPQIQSHCAVSSDTGAYCGYWVGGGCPYHRCGDGRVDPNEGTWGWDYEGRCFLRNICLLWWHCRRYQDGMGAYATDGPKLKHEK